jgi:hypothetical protein
MSELWVFDSILHTQNSLKAGSRRSHRRQQRQPRQQARAAFWSTLLLLLALYSTYAQAQYAMHTCWALSSNMAQALMASSDSAHAKQLKPQGRCCTFETTGKVLYNTSLLCATYHNMRIALRAVSDGVAQVLMGTGSSLRPSGRPSTCQMTLSSTSHSPVTSPAQVSGAARALESSLAFDLGPQYCSREAVRF